MNKKSKLESLRRFKYKKSVSFAVRGIRELIMELINIRELVITYDSNQNGEIGRNTALRGGARHSRSACWAMRGK